jgi:uncharacterized membrane protein YheB (UPF0754 family)
MNENKITVTVDGYDASQVGSWLDDKIGRAISGKLEEKIEDAVEQRVSKLVEEITRERVSKEIEAVLEAGWAQTNNYGEPTGKTFTVRDRVNSFFNGTDRYSSESFVSRWVRESIDRDLKKAVDEEVATAKAKLRQMFDEAITGKFATTIREALGVK